MTGPVLARRYTRTGECKELSRLPGDRGYTVTVNGGVPDARRRLTIAEAAAWWDWAAYRLGPRPATAATAAKEAA